MTSKDYYNIKVVNDIIYNECTHVVSVFKDYLIMDDISEFMKRSYTLFEIKPRLTKIYEFYDKYSKVFPNYVGLPESKYMFKNIERKQRMIDEKQMHKQEQEKRLLERPGKKAGNGGYSDLLDSSESVNQIFNSEFVECMKNVVPLSARHSSEQSSVNSHSQLEEHKSQSMRISEHSESQNHEQSSVIDIMKEI